MNEISTPGWIIQTGSWIKNNILLATVMIGLIFTATSQWESAGLPMIASRSYADATPLEYIIKSGINKQDYPNVKNYIDKRDDSIRAELNERMNNLELQNTKIISKVDLMLTLMQSRWVQPTETRP